MIAPRPAEVVMRLARMGAAHPTRLSFLRVLLRRVQAEGWQFDRPLWQIDAKGVGRAIYRARGPSRSYCLIAFAHDLPDEMRSDRVIATAWDATFALTDGMPDAAALDDLAANVPLQEAGRVGPHVLTLSRANRSVRLFQHVVDRLAKGRQPDPARLAEVGYLMRTTAVYGAGKFGAADWPEVAARPELSAPFQAEMLTVWLIRQFTVDMADHLAKAQGGAQAVALDPSLRQRLGVGNATGLGMAPFLIRHPRLLNNWMAARETALARVRSLTIATPGAVAGLRAALSDARKNVRDWPRHHPMQTERVGGLSRDLARLARHLRGFPGRRPMPWDRLWRWGEARLGLEGQEALAALMLEPHGDLIDDLAAQMAADEAEGFRLNGSVTTSALKAQLHRHYAWALTPDFTRPEAEARF